MLRLSTRLILSLLAAAILLATTDTFNPPASGDDGSVTGTSATWPPSVGQSSNTSSTQTSPNRDFAAGTYTIGLGLMRFDSSALPDTATITDAKLRLCISSTNVIVGDSPDFGVEYFSTSNWPIGTEDFTNTPSNNAHGYTLLSSLTTGGTCTYNEFALTSPNTNVSKTGYTGFRLHVRTSGAPTGQSRLTYFNMDNGSNKPELQVTYFVGGLFTTVVVTGG